MAEKNVASTDDGLKFTGKLFGGIIADINRRRPSYLNDFKQGFHSKVAGATLFLYFAALANAIAFGALTGALTGNQIGIMEMIVVTAIGGILFALFSGQPLTILGGTGPITIFTGLIFVTCSQLDLPFLATYAWIGIWSGVILMILAVTDASALMKYFTRFTDEIFAALISVIFIVEAGKDIMKAFGPEGYGLSSAFLTFMVAMGTFSISRFLKQATNTPYLRRTYRNFLSDFGPSIAIVAMTLLALSFSDVKLNTPVVPETISTTTGRPWLVNIFELPTWAIFATIGPAFLATILLFLDQNITTRLVNSSDNKLKKGSGYHLDLAVVGVIVFVGSIFALPWIVAATVHSLNHVRALADVKVEDAGGGTKKEVIVSVRENRLSGLGIHTMIAASLLFMSYVAYIPMPVLFGLFLFMGFASLTGNQFYERIMLWVTDPKLYPSASYLKVVSSRDVHKFTLIQLICFIILWVLKTSKVGILFPLMIAALVPIRLFVSRYFKKEAIEALVAEDNEEEEKIGGVL